MIATRHDRHAEYTGPRSTPASTCSWRSRSRSTRRELARVAAAAAEAPGVLVVGFNRRFAPLAVRMRDALGGRGPLLMTYRVNAGRLPRTHWTRDPRGRRRTDRRRGVSLRRLRDVPRRRGPGLDRERRGGRRLGAAGGQRRRDAGFPDGSLAQIVYSALGDTSLAKERIEVLGEAGAGVLDDFRKLRSTPTARRDGRVRQGTRATPPSSPPFSTGCRTGEQPWPVEDMAG